MKFHVQFLILNTKGKLDEACGSEGVYILDGRNSLRTMKVDAIMRFHKMNKIHNYVGWRIKQGSRFDNSVIINQWILSGEHTRHLHL